MIRFHHYPPINTGALVALRRRGKTLYLTVVEAAAHSAPAYTMSDEAPRIYEEVTRTGRLSAWVHWAAFVIDPEQRFENDREARAFIEEHLDKIPDKK